MPGCTLTAFANENYEEPFQEFDSVATHTNIVGYIVTNGCAKAFGSMRCRCSMSPIDCTATDVWQESLTCDNLATSEPKVLSMSFYPDFILILSRFYPNLINTNYILILKKSG